MSLSDIQIAAARVFVQEFAEVKAYGGGVQAVIRLYDDQGRVEVALSARDGWQGRDAALDELAERLAARFART